MRPLGPLRAAREAINTPERAPQLIAHVHSTLHTGDARILPEALFALHDAPTARERLIDTARTLIAQPDVARPDGSFVPYELWAIPLLYSANHAGDCWFFPRLAELERVLQKHLGVMDASAIALARDNDLPIIVFSLDEPGGFRGILSGSGTYTRVHG